jgi:putative SOS response-associated peptidase YedK
MCNLYSLTKKRDGVARFFRVSHNRAAAYEPLSAIFPGHTAPIIKQSADGEIPRRSSRLAGYGWRSRSCQRLRCGLRQALVVGTPAERAPGVQRILKMPVPDDVVEIRASADRLVERFAPDP